MFNTFEAISLLKPWDINLPKIRIGGDGDGGYVVVDRLRPEQPVLSYGIGKFYEFDRQLALAGHKVFMFDHTIEKIEDLHPNMSLKLEGVGAQPDRDAKLQTIKNHISEYKIKSSEIILKVDIEGSEYRVLPALEEEVFESTEQLLLEVHAMERLSNPAFLTNFVNMFRKINRHFTLCHVHANNFDGDDGYAFLDGLIIPKILELTYIKTDLVNRTPSKTVYPTALDSPNTKKPDKLLWMYPFAPEGASVSDYREAFNRRRIYEKLAGRPVQ